MIINCIRQALIDGPTNSVSRQAIAYRHLILTPYTIPSLPRAAGTGAIKKAFEKSQVGEKWQGSSWAKKLAARDSRRAATDFERFEVGLLKRQRRDLVRGHFTRLDGWKERIAESFCLDFVAHRSARLTPRRRRLPPKHLFSLTETCGMRTLEEIEERTMQ
jgi:ribosomal protein L14E/L6E/L27E